MAEKKKMTPMMEQYSTIKAEYPDAFLFYRLGDFYELFYDDAIKGAQILELTLTQRNKNSENAIPMCGVPHHAAANYVDILIEQGYKVAICEQVEDPSTAKGMVKREVVQLVTPGTRLERSGVENKENNFLAVIHQDQTASEKPCGFAYVDLSTGEVKSTILHDLGTTLLDELARLKVKEVILTKTPASDLLNALAKLNILVSYQTEQTTFAETSYVSQNLTHALEKNSVSYLVNYLHVTQKRSLSHLQQAQHYETSNFLKLDHDSMRNLELMQNLRTNKKQGTLLWLLDQTKTAMGGRLLKQWLNRPLLQKDEIIKRQKMVNALLISFFERSTLQEELSQVYDLERLAGRVAFGSVNARDLIQLKNSLSHIPKIRYLLEELSLEADFSSLLADLDPLTNLVALIEQALVPEPPLAITEGGIINDHFNAQLDEYRNAMINGKKWLAELEAREREITGINKLKIGYNRVFGYYIEVTKGNLAKLDAKRYERKQTLANAERFITPELKAKERLILEAENKGTELEYQIFLEIRAAVQQQIKAIQKNAHALAQIDVLQSFALISEENQFVMPEFTNNHDLNIKAGWHPVVEKVIGKQKYVPNDVTMEPDNHLLLITGPNMSGKSTYMRQLALTVIMAQIGCFVPAATAQVPLFNQIFTRIGAADDLIGGDSTFMVEMKEANQALMKADANSLILFDEIGRGTATYDGMALAQAIIEYLNKNVKAKTLFSTHYHELTELANTVPGLKNIHVDAIEENDQLVFLHQMQPGPADRSYGIHVAKLAGMPDSLLQRADTILQALENNQPTTSQPLTVKPDLDSTINETTAQLALFNLPEVADISLNEAKQAIIDEIKATDFMQMKLFDIVKTAVAWQEQLKGLESGDEHE